MKDEATIRFVREHREDDVRALALHARRDGEVDLPWALDQIQGWQTARRNGNRLSEEPFRKENIYENSKGII